MSNRNALLQAAKELLRTRGYARITARDLVAASGANLSSIGYHFGSKEDLLALAVDELLLEWTSYLTSAAAADPAMSPLERMGASWRRMLGEMPEQEPLMLAFVESVGPSVRSPAMRAKLGQHYARTRADVADSVRDSIGDAPGADPEVIAAYLIAVHDGFMLQFLADPTSVPTGDRLLEALGAALTSALDREQPTQ